MLATSRILQRPFAADAYLKQILADSVEDSGSMVQRIWNSAVMSRWLQQKVAAESVVAKRASNLRAAKHRFESITKPLGRMLLQMHEFMDVVQDIILRKTDGTSVLCVAWVQSLSAEKLVQLAMLADASDELLILTRALDCEAVDISTIHEVVDNCLRTLEALFAKSMCLSVIGYTKHVMDLLAHARVFHLPRGRMVLLGGTHVDMTAVSATCLTRMRAWLALVRETIMTEFPDYEVFQAFRVFNLGARGPSKGGWNLGASQEPATADSEDPVQVHLARLAAVCNVDGPALQAEFLQHFPIAAKLKHQSVDHDNKAAWRAAVESTQLHHATRQSYPVAALMPVLSRYLAWTAATSGVEQNFSVALRAITPQRAGSMDGVVEDTALRFACYKPKTAGEEEQLINRARIIYEEHFGPPRTRAGFRVDSGLFRSGTSTGTEAAWLRARRAAAREAVGQVGAANPEYPIEPGAWSEKHQKELQHQQQQQKKRKLEAYRDGVLLEHELFAGIQEAAEEERINHQKADKELKRKHSKRNATAPGKKALDLAGACVFVDANVANGAEVQDVLRSRGCVIQDMTNVSNKFFVVPEVDAVRERIKWVVGLTGACLVPPDTVLTDNLTGAFVWFKALVKAKHLTVVCISQRFQQKHHVLTGIVKAAAGIEGSTWEVVDPEADLDAVRKEAAKRSRNKAVCCALIRDGENVLKGWKALTKHDVEKKFAVDVRASSVRR